MVAAPTTVCSVPAAHGVQLVQAMAFAVVLKVPDAQPEQMRSDVLEPAEETNCPAEQDDHAVHMVDAFASLSHDPLGHVSLGVDPPAQYVPGSQAAHTAALRSVAGAVSTVPAEHAFCTRHSAWFGALVYVPEGHAAQERSDTDEPDALT